MDDLKLIKKHYDEKMMHLCRELFPTILETPGLLFSIMSSTFAYNKFLYDDIIYQHLEDEFKSAIYSRTYKRTDDNSSQGKTPTELLDEAGYILYECKTEEDIQSFKKYYAKGEELCTFRGGRLERCKVFFAVKKNVEKIRREDFKYPRRQDEYGTSVISIQFTHSVPNTLSIKNRYNHTVANPDSTFSNDLDNIIEGLSDAFRETYDLTYVNDEGEDIEIEGYVRANDGKYYKYNFERNNIYYCPNNIVIDNYEVKEFDKSRYLLIENFVLDLQKKTIMPYQHLMRNYGYQEDTFCDSINNLVENSNESAIKKIEIKVDRETKEKIIIINDDIIIKINQENRIKEYTNPHVKQIGYDFLYECDSIEKISLANITKIGAHFLEKATNIKVVDLPNAIKIGNNFLTNAIHVKEVNLPNAEYIGSDFLCYGTRDLEGISLPKAKIILDNFMYSRVLNYVYLPEVEKIGDNFLHSIQCNFEELELPKVIEVGRSFMLFVNPICAALKKVIMPCVKKIGDNFLQYNTTVEEFYTPELEEIGKNSAIEIRESGITGGIK